MTEKRFRYDNGVWDNNVEDMADALLTEKECCDLLNKLSEENEELKSDLDYFQKTYEIEERGLDIVAPMCTIGSPTPSRLELFKENEQLKQAYTQLKHRHSLLHDVCVDAECDRDSYQKDVSSLEKENEQLKEENKALKEIKEFLELLTTHRGEMVSMANSIIQDLPNTPTVKAQEMWYEFKEEMYQEWKKKRGIK